MYIIIYDECWIHYCLNRVMYFFDIGHVNKYMIMLFKLVLAISKSYYAQTVVRFSGVRKKNMMIYHYS